MAKKTSSYNKPPILEAIIKIAYIPSGKSFDFDKLPKALSKDFPVKRELIKDTLEYQINESKSSVSNSRIKEGFEFLSLDGNKIIRLTTDYASYHIKENYKDWDNFYKIFEEIILYIFKKSKFKTNSLSVRYINRIDIPKISFEMSEYFKLYPNFYKKFIMNSFFTQIQLSLSQDTLCIVNQAVTQPIKAGFTSLILDLDLIKTKELDDKGDIERAFLQLRKSKNEIFELSITDKTRELFL
ncbi:MAG: TIGR04255 family protein [Rickettsiales bacterium]|nr:TIGR04255 family protein [Rickettsiales bacterium]